MSLADEWREREDELPAGWVGAHLELTVDEADADRAAGLLAPAQPLRAGAGVLRLAVARDGGGPGPTALARLFARLDAAGVAGSLRVLDSEAAPEPVAAPPAAAATLAGAWAAELGKLPPDWSDLFGEIDLISSDYLEAAALALAPINPRRELPGTTFRFRCAASFGYGASPGMVGRCLERCDEKGIRGTVTVLRALSDTRAVGTQGPVWQIGGRTV